MTSPYMETEGANGLSVFQRVIVLFIGKSSPAEVNKHDY